MTQGPTLEVLESHGPTVALHFHLESRCFPPAPHMVGAAQAAIDAVNSGDNWRPIDLPDGMRHRGGTQAPAFTIVGAWRLEAFIRTAEDE